MTPPHLPVTVAVLLLFLCLQATPPAAAAAAADPTPTPWPPQFHATLVMDYHGNMSVADLWYDWPGGRNLHVTRYQLAADAPFYDNEWNNGTSFFYTPARRTCRSAAVGVGILRPDWLRPGAVYLGRRDAGGFDCHVWAKADFITYYEDVKIKRPVKWVFYTGRIAYVMSFEVGAVLEDAAWQAPEYCFTKDGGLADAETTTKIMAAASSPGACCDCEDSSCGHVMFPSWSPGRALALWAWRCGVNRVAMIYITCPHVPVPLVQ